MSLLFVGAFALTSCQDDFDDPGMTTPESTWLADANNYQLMTISEVKAKFWSDDTNYYWTDSEGKPYIPTTEDGKHILVKARVISSDASGNVYKSLYIQDASGALTLSVNANSMNNQYRRGQEIVLDLTGMTIGKYAGLQQLGFPEDSPQYGKQTTFMPYQFFLEHSQKNGAPNLAEVDTIVINDFSELSGGPEVIRKWQSQLVRFNNCSFADGGKATFAESKTTVSRTLNVQGGSIDVRTSGYSNFYANVLPEGKGDVVGLLGYFNSSYQLTLIDARGCMNFGNPTIGPGGEDNPYTVDQAISVISGGGSINNVWTTGYIVGAVAAGVQSVTSNADIEFAKNPDLPNTLVIAQSPDCTEWSQCMVIELPQNSALRQYGNLVDNPGNYKKQIWLLGNLGRYLGTFAVTGNNGAAANFRIDGLEIPDDPNPPTPPVEDGNGTKESPYTLSQVIAMNPTSTTESPAGGAGVYIEGYIVGSMPASGTYLDKTNFGLADASTTNIVIAPTADCTDYTQCVGIQLPKGEVRDALSLSLNPGNLGRKVVLKGDVMLYCKGPGLKNTSEYEFVTGGDTPTPTPPPAGEGDGTESKPFAVSQVIAMNPTSTTESPAGGSNIFVQGYIVGSMPASGTYLDKTNFGLTDASTTNIVIGPTPDCTDYKLCVGVQLPKGEVRDALSLSLNPGNLGKNVVLNGDVMMYCKGPGLKNTKSYKFVN